MTRILKSGKQFRVNIPREIIIQTGWDEDTELNIFPYLKEPDEEINENTPIFMKKITHKVGSKK